MGPKARQAALPRGQDGSIISRSNTNAKMHTLSTIAKKSLLPLLCPGLVGMPLSWNQRHWQLTASGRYLTVLRCGELV